MRAQMQPERFWLAVRYDANRVVVYLTTVKVHGTIPANGFFDVVELPASYPA